MESESPQAFIFMKVGSHAGESLEEIVERKQRELREAGMVFWGYGGNPCHPIKQVQPFAQEWVPRVGSIQMLMQPIVSPATSNDLPANPANECSVDNKKWERLPPGVIVTGSKYAFVLDEFKPVQMDLDLGEFEVGIGRRRGRNAARYIRGLVSRGCLVATQSVDTEREVQQRPIPTSPIGFQARLKHPYAVFLR